MATIVAMASACGPSYPRGWLLQDPQPSAQAVALECTDVRVAWLDRPGVILAYRVGNHCMGPVRVDLGAVTVRGGVDGALVDLPVRDPRQELRPGTLDGRGAFVEEIGYETGGVTPSRVCVSLDGITEDAAGLPPLCLSRAETRAARDEDEEEDDDETEELADEQLSDEHVDDEADATTAADPGEGAQ
ncbi:MAG: hypothetical protein KF729_22370 [Sandaracinaceae bacterium]|nr:hypothetical protein [Sandaracinaceae bacterium]